MGKRRGNGEGCIRERKDGRWLVEMQTGIKADGKPKKIFKYAKSQAEAIEVLSKLKSELMIGVDNSKGAVKTGEWCFKWLDTYKRKLKPSTRTSYQNNIRVHINEHIGGVALNKLTTHQIQRMLDSIYDDGGSLSLVIKVYNVLNGALKKAAELGMIAKNPCVGVGFPADDKQAIRVFTVDEQRLFMDALENEDESLQTLMLTYLWTGCRLGEIPALTWNDIDLSSRQISITKKVMLIHNYYSKDKKTFQEVQPYLKTKAGKRKVVITPMLVDILKAHMEVQKQQAAALGKKWSMGDIVFPTSKGTIAYTRNIQEKFERIIQKIGIKGATMHSLRHTYATRLFEAEVDIKCISEQLGHASVKVTYDTYVHVMPNKKVKEIEKLSALDSMFSK